MYCQVVYICGLIPARIRHALSDLPETLDATYERTLREIKKPEWEMALRLFQFVAIACRPLRVKELAELLAFDFDAGPIPEFHEGWRLEDPVDAVLSTCSSLLAIVDGGYPFGKVVQFSHFSVKEFLTSARLAEANDIILRRYHISMIHAHTLAVQACLGILLHLDTDVVTWDSLNDFPLAIYAAKHWHYHARFEDVSQKVEDGMQKLFDPSNSHLAVCVWHIWTCGLEIPSRWSVRGSDSPPPPCGTPLHYAALWGLHHIVKFLVFNHPQDVHSRGFTCNATPLHLASEEGHTKAARFLLEHDADVTAQTEHGSTPLHLASKRGRLEVASMLIECGADLTAQDQYCKTPLHLALDKGQVEVADMLIKCGADVTAQDHCCKTPLHLVLERGQVEVAGMLIKWGADVTAQDQFCKTPLHLASEIEVAGMLIERGADVTAQDQYCNTPLHLASKQGRVEVSDMLIKCGADVTAQNQYCETPLHLAGQVGLAGMFIERGADVTARDAYESTPLHLASMWGRLEIAGILIERGADVTAQNEFMSTPLHLASEEGQLEVASMLIERGADVTAQNKDRSTPLHLASQQGALEVAGMLIRRGAVVTAQNRNGSTPLHLVSIQPEWVTKPSEEYYVEIAQKLLEHGADVTVRNKNGRTPYDLASSRRGNKKVACVLLQHGAKT